MTTEYLSRRNYLLARDLLAEGQDFAAISEQTGLTANTIAAIQADRIQPSRIVVEDDDPLREEMLTARRCHGCGALVFHWPCLACQLAAGGPTTKSQRLTLDQSLEKLRRARTAQRGRQSAPDRRAA